MMEDDRWMYQEMFLDQDTHFYNISVNTSHSSVHVPTNVYDKHPMVMSALQWSEALDNVFVNNYNSDPALSWQYFGSDTGILRHYPGKILGRRHRRAVLYNWFSFQPWNGSQKSLKQRKWTRMIVEHVPGTLKPPPVRKMSSFYWIIPVQ